MQTVDVPYPLLFVCFCCSKARWPSNNNIYKRLDTCSCSFRCNLWLIGVSNKFGHMLSVLLNFGWNNVHYLGWNNGWRGVSVCIKADRRVIFTILRWLFQSDDNVLLLQKNIDLQINYSWDCGNSIPFVWHKMFCMSHVVTDAFLRLMYLITTYFAFLPYIEASTVTGVSQLILNFNGGVTVLLSPLNFTVFEF